MFKMRNIGVFGLGGVIFVNNVNNVNSGSFDPFIEKYHIMEINYACFISLNHVCSIVTNSTLSLDRSIKETGEND
uniref:Uncharacterized protein n=1 Tax=uncultured marine crenarchaeote HF4000_APKG6D9 TaxID=455597 RepID=B3T951_9ARCH|nr:hypothetical protein ALOHA_HF4000APKG6D9ctg2g15 [uncultured marine crenarchaeote HF4000_APKG6D9]